MKTTEFIWQNGKYIKWNEATVHVLSHTLHYGGGAFEGIRVYYSKARKSPIFFRLKDHIERLIFSAKALGMDVSSYSIEVLSDIICKLILKNDMKEGYVRPLFYYGYHSLGVRPIENPVELVIACWPWEQYLSHSFIDVKTSQFVRVHPATTVPGAKLCGNYLNSQLASLEIKNKKYQEVLLLDVNNYVAEGAGENLFIVKDGELYTPKLGNILPGITRETIIFLAKKGGYKVNETDLTLNDIYHADEAFFTGTAAEVTPIRSLDDRLIGAPNVVGSTSKRLQLAYSKLVRGELDYFENYITILKKELLSVA